ncbi:MAG: hypothetical protein ABI217_05575, partial [Chthoniobacterales bacterium]
FAKGFRNSMAFAAACLPLVFGTIMAARDRALWNRRRAERITLLGLLAVSAIGASAGGRFYVHYYIQLVPPLCLLAAPYYAQLWTGNRAAPGRWFGPRLTQAWLALTVVAFSIIHVIDLRALPQTSAAGRYLAEHAAPNDRIFVWGQAAKIYLDARRRPASRYVESYPLTGHLFGGIVPGFDSRKWIVPGAWKNLEEDFAKHPPAYIVDVQIDTDQLHPMRDFPILAKLVAEKYRPVAQTAEGIIYQRK